MKVRARVLQIVSSTLAFLVVAFAILVGTFAAELSPGFIRRPFIPISLLVWLGLPMGVAYWVWRGLGRRWQLPGVVEQVRRRPRIAVAIAVAYLATAVFGVPAAQSQQQSWAVAEYKRLRDTGTRDVWDAHPYIWNYAALPLLPGVILSYREYQLAGLYGLGGLELTLWYGVGVRSLGVFPIWVS